DQDNPHVPAHCRMRGFDRDLIRGGHYGQRPLCAALTGRTHGCTDQPANVKKTLANSEPSTHGTKRTFASASVDVCFSNRPSGVKHFQGYPPTPASMSLTGSRFSSDSAPRPFHRGIRRRGGTILWATLPSL